MPDRLLTIENLSVQFKTDDGLVQAVDSLSYDLHPGETLGIVGESGSGKSVSSLAILGLIPKPPGRVTSGRAIFEGRDLLRLGRRKLSGIRGNRIAMIFQDPMTSLNPFLTVADQLTEVTRRHLGYTHSQSLRHAIEMLEARGDSRRRPAGVRLPASILGWNAAARDDRDCTFLQAADSHRRRAHHGARCDHSAQILELMKELQASDGTSIILITHDLGIVANSCGRVNVMYAGKFVEEATVDDLFEPTAPLYRRPVAIDSALDAGPTGLLPSKANPRISRIFPAAAPSTPAAPTCCQSAATSSPPRQSTQTDNATPATIRPAPQ